MKLLSLCAPQALLPLPPKPSVGFLEVVGGYDYFTYGLILDGGAFAVAFAFEFAAPPVVEDF